MHHKNTLPPATRVQTAVYINFGVVYTLLAVDYQRVDILKCRV